MIKVAYRFDPITLHFYKRLNGITEILGYITTHKGKLTRQQKLTIIKANGEWVEI